jgi:hypothetical protein
MRLRSVGKKRHYLIRELQVVEGGQIKEVLQKRVLEVPPRNYIFAFSQSGLGRTYDDFCGKLRKCLDEKNAHVHGVCVLDQNWFAGRQAFRTPAELFGQHGNGLLTLYFYFLKVQENYHVYPMDLEAYLTNQ